jgi:CheY-like chemotaxis protein
MSPVTPQIAVLDDEARMTEVLAMLLRREGHEVRCFTDPQVCLAAIAEQARAAPHEGAAGGEGEGGGGEGAGAVAAGRHGQGILRWRRGGVGVGPTGVHRGLQAREEARAGVGVEPGRGVGHGQQAVEVVVAGVAGVRGHCAPPGGPRRG